MLNDGLGCVTSCLRTWLTAHLSVLRPAVYEAGFEAGYLTGRHDAEHASFLQDDDRITPSSGHGSRCHPEHPHANVHFHPLGLSGLGGLSGFELEGHTIVWAFTLQLQSWRLVKWCWSSKSRLSLTRPPSLPPVSFLQNWLTLA